MGGGGEEINLDRGRNRFLNYLLVAHHMRAVAVDHARESDYLFGQDLEGKKSESNQITKFITIHCLIRFS